MISSTKKELEYGFQDMKGILYLKIRKAKQNTNKADTNMASSSLLNQATNTSTEQLLEKEDLYQISDPIVKIIYLD